jgi:hypothetical protein
VVRTCQAEAKGVIDDDGFILKALSTLRACGLILGLLFCWHLSCPFATDPLFKALVWLQEDTCC